VSSRDRFNVACAALVLLLLFGCAANPPAPIADRTGARHVPPAAAAPEHPVAQPASGEHTEPSEQPHEPVFGADVSARDNRATSALLAAADADLDAGRAASAAAKIDRALQIDAQDPAIWHRLARVKFMEGDRAQALAMARRSNALAGIGPRLAASNWLLIAEIKRLDGDRAGREQALAEAERYSALAAE